MVGKGLKDYASKMGLKVSNGVVYGVIGGYMVTLKEGYNTKEISVSGIINEESARVITEFLSTPGAKKEYRIANFNVLREGIVFEIADSIGTMKKIEAFLVFLPNFLRANGVMGDGFCTACGNVIDPTTSQSRVVLVNGAAHRLHENCTGALMQRANFEQVNHEMTEKNLEKGVLGAALGALLGSIVWAIVYYIGWIAGIVGALIGTLAVKGYEKMGGKVCKAKMTVVLVATILGVIFGQFMGCVISCVIDGGADIITAILYCFSLFGDGEFIGAFIADLVIGIIFAILGILGLLKKTSKENQSATLNTIVLE